MLFLFLTSLCIQCNSSERHAEHTALLPTAVRPIYRVGLWMKVVKLYDKLYDERKKESKLNKKKRNNTQTPISLMHTLSKPCCACRLFYNKICAFDAFFFARVLVSIFFFIARSFACNIQPSAFPFLCGASATLIDIIKLDFLAVLLLMLHCF